MIYNQPLTTAMFAYRLYLSLATMYDKDAAAFTLDPALYYLKDSRNYAELFRFKAARQFIKFCKIASGLNGVVSVNKKDGLVYVQQGR